MFLNDDDALLRNWELISATIRSSFDSTQMYVEYGSVVPMNVTIHFTIMEHPDHLELIRTSIPFNVGGDLYERCLPMFAALRQLPHLGLLLDLRSVAAGVGPDFEEKIAHVRREIIMHHPRIAFLVETPLGRLQVSRQLREDEAGSHIRVFSDERPAREFARGVLNATPFT